MHVYAGAIYDRNKENDMEATIHRDDVSSSCQRTLVTPSPMSSDPIVVMKNFLGPCWGEVRVTEIVSILGSKVFFLVVGSRSPKP